MNGWVIVVVYDGPMQLEVFGPFSSAHDAEEASLAIPRHGRRYSVYISNLQATP